MKDYIKNLKIPHSHNITFDGKYLKMSYQDLYLCGDIVFNNFDKMRTLNIEELKLDESSIKSIVDNFIKNALIRNKTRPYCIKLLQDIDNIDYENFWNLNYQSIKTIIA